MDYEIKEKLVVIGGIIILLMAALAVIVHFGDKARDRDLRECKIACGVNAMWLRNRYGTDPDCLCKINGIWQIQKYEVSQ